ncbi:MAG TPA: hypothetical protein VH234_05440 [Candidatus Saccharimonadales bacterium]|jgi:hypothetical protein|nr:hypothetical protein [Candidatus Saccharimonadales bacterium]
MAMEVRSHHHAVPIVLVVAAVLALATVTAGHLTTKQYAATRALTTRIFNIQPTENGLAKITIIKPATAQTNLAWAQAGSEASLSLSLQ